MLGQQGDALALMARRKAAEGAIDGVLAELGALGYGATHPPTVDAQGFPVSDAAAVRLLRARLAGLLGDHRRLTSDIEALLPGAMAGSGVSPASPQAPRPIARVAQVHPETPASAAGLLPGDLVLAFNAVDNAALGAANPLGAISAEYSSCAATSRPLALRVLRDGETVTLSIQTAPNTPLGVYLVPCQ